MNHHLWTLDVKIHIDYTKTDAEKYHNKITNITLSQNKLTIYTNGSGIEGNIGATTNETPTPWGETTHNIYAAELEAGMTLDIAKESDTKSTKCEVWADNQAAIKAVAKARQQSGQQIIKRVLNTLEET